MQNNKNVCWGNEAGHKVPNWRDPPPPSTPWCLTEQQQHMMLNITINLSLSLSLSWSTHEANKVSGTCKVGQHKEREQHPRAFNSWTRLRVVYHRSVLEYGLWTRGPHLLTHKARLEKIPRKVARMFTAERCELWWKNNATKPWLHGRENKYETWSWHTQFSKDRDRHG